MSELPYTRMATSARAIRLHVKIEMRDGAGVLATCRRLGDDKLLLAVDERCTAKGTWIVSRLWTLRATNASLSDWIAAEKGKAAIESVTSSGGQWSAQGLFAPFSLRQGNGSEDHDA